MMSELRGTFSLWSEIIDPDTLSRQLNIQADKTSTKGSEREIRKLLPEKHGWHITSSIFDAKCIDDIANIVLQRTLALKDRLQDVKREDATLEARFYFLIISPKPSEISLYISNYNIKSFSDYNASVDIVFDT